MYKYYLGILLTLCLSCNTTKSIQDPISEITEPELKNVMQKVFTAMGGLSNWQTKKSIHFDKKTELYLASGEVEKATFQRHDYYNQPSSKIDISWEANKVAHLLRFEDGKAQKQVNGKVDTSVNTSAITNSIMASTFVVGVPFKLMDDGAAFSYEGIQTIANGKRVHVVKAIYNPDAHANHTKSDIWWHYFDEKTYHQLGYKVQLFDHTSYVENLTFERVGGFLLTTSRKSWRLDEQGNKAYLRAAYEYANYKVK